MYLNCKSVRGPREEGRLEERGRNVYYYSFFQLAFASWPSSYRTTSFFFPRLMSAAAAAAAADNDDRSSSERDAEDPDSLSLSNSDPHFAPLPENAFIIIIIIDSPAATGSSQYSSK